MSHYFWQQIELYLVKSIQFLGIITVIRNVESMVKREKCFFRDIMSTKETLLCSGYRGLGQEGHAILILVPGNSDVDS